MINIDFKEQLGVYSQKNARKMRIFCMLRQVSYNFMGPKMFLNELRLFEICFGTSMFATPFIWNDICADVVTFIKSVSALTSTTESTLF